MANSWMMDGTLPCQALSLLYTDDKRRHAGMILPTHHRNEKSDRTIKPCRFTLS
jgi:hypothetical protein